MYAKRRKPPMDPVLKAVLIFTPLILVARLAAGLLLSSVFFWMYLLQWVLYIANGYAAASFYLNNAKPRTFDQKHKARSEAVKRGAAAGALVGILSWILLVIIIAIFKLDTMFGLWGGLVWFATQLGIVCVMPMDVVAFFTWGAFGGWLRSRS